MADRERRDYRGQFHETLIHQRSRVQTIRIRAVAAFRSGDPKSISQINHAIHGEIGGRHFSYTTSLSDILTLIERMVPNWEIKSITPTGQYHQIIMADISGRNRPDFQNKWVSTCLEYALIYTILSVHLIDLNSMVDELHGLPEKMNQI